MFQGSQAEELPQGDEDVKPKLNLLIHYEGQGEMS